jgi:aryl-alcohol dehydrogenase-like predicted oxidoreductase
VGYTEGMAQIPTRPLGASGLNVSVVGLGGNNFGRRLDLDGTRAVVDAALAEGVTFFDTADIYGGAGASEELLGEVLAGRRDQVVLATKPEQARANAAAARWTPSAEDLEALTDVLEAAART